MSDLVHVLRIQDLRVDVRLGWPAEERAQTQEARLSVEIRLCRAPLAETSDDLADAVDYGLLCAELKRTVESGEFRLIERMAHECLMVSRVHAGPHAQAAVKVHKVRPPVEGLLGGATYACGDFSIP